MVREDDTIQYVVKTYLANMKELLDHCYKYNKSKSNGSKYINKGNWNECKIVAKLIRNGKYLVFVLKKNFSDKKNKRNTSYVKFI